MGVASILGFLVLSCHGPDLGILFIPGSYIKVLSFSLFCQEPFKSGHSDKSDSVSYSKKLTWVCTEPPWLALFALILV